MTKKRPPNWLINPFLRMDAAVREQQAAYRAHHQQRTQQRPQADGPGQAEWTHHSSYIPTPPARSAPITPRAGTAQRDVRLAAVARTIYAACFPTEEVAVGFDEAERLDTIHYRRAVEAARVARSLCAEDGGQLDLVLG